MIGLHTAASQYQTTDFRERLDVLRRSGADELADLLESYANQFDMEGAAKLISKVLGETND